MKRKNYISLANKAVNIQISELKKIMSSSSPTLLEYIRNTDIIPIAHRGASLLAGENSTEAFRKANGFEFLEDFFRIFSKSISPEMSDPASGLANLSIMKTLFEYCQGFFVLVYFFNSIGIIEFYFFDSKKITSR